MANRETILIDSIDISSLGAKLIDYSVLGFSGFKDGGFKNFEGIDGVIDSPSNSVSGATGSITVIFEGANESEVNQKYRTFKQKIRSKSFWNISTREDPNYYRIGKFLGESEPGTLTEVPIYAQAWLATKIAIQFKDGYEYLKNNAELNYVYNTTNQGMFLDNDGRETRNLKVKLTSSTDLSGYFRIEIAGQGSLEFGSDGVFIPSGNTILMNFSTFELIRLSSTNVVTNMFAYIKSGKFFKVPNGRSTIRIAYKSNAAGTWQYNLPVTAKIQLEKSYY